MIETAFDESGDASGVSHFPYDEIDERLAAAPITHAAASHPTAQFHEQALFALESALAWAVQDVPKNCNGIEIRTTILAWKFLPHLRAKTLTEIAAMIGRDKQSVGRWHDDFKEHFSPPGKVVDDPE
jgi:hypothetical protein